MVERVDLCEVEEVDSDDPWVCELPAAHPGGHSFELESGGGRALTPQREMQMVDAVRRVLAEDRAREEPERRN
ncbi:hypothetical protein [Spirillospora sp. CA-128828]|uniref:hypothetical protein n=1 Tax=Spirillospora sp. CA-128828 TaxID=3240033 RepID=UPI003D93A798